MENTLQAPPQSDDFFDRLEAVRTRNIRKFQAKRREDLAKKRGKTNFIRILLNWLF